jgi:WD40 repeat protein
MRLRLLLLVFAVLAGGVIAGAKGIVGDPLDPVRNIALPCEAVSTPGLVPRAAKNIAHVANVCGFVGTDIEFQSRKASDGTVHDYAFVGTMGGGTRIFDVTDPAHPVAAGRYTDPGYQNDVQVSGDLLVLGFDSLSPSGATSLCLRTKGSGTAGQTRAGVDIVKLVYDRESATFGTQLVDCYLSSLSSAGAHTTTIHPSGKYLTVNTSFNGLEVVDIRTAPATLVRTIPEPVADDAHDVSFSRDGNRLYSAGLDSTRILDVTDIFNKPATLLQTIPNNPSAAQGGDGQVIQLSHQSDTSSDGKVLVVTDEAGGGVTETRCNEGPSGKIGAAHFWNLAVSPAHKLGSWLYPNPVLTPDPLAPALASIGRSERGCTIHVFRNGGNGSAGPGEIARGFDGVSRLPGRQFVTAHYGAGTWHVDFSKASSSTDGVAEDPRSTWGNTLGWNVMPGADTWSAKEYKGYVYTGDMARGFDVFALTSCDGVACLVRPTNTPGRARGYGSVDDEPAEISILSGPSRGGTAAFALDVRYLAGQAAPAGLLFFDDRSGPRVKATGIDSLTITGSRASITGRATVDGVPGISFFVEVEDLGHNADSFRIVLGDGYAAGGVLLKGKVEVTGGLVAPTP